MTPFTLTDTDLERLQVYANLGIPLQAAARRFGVKRATLAAALDRQGLGPWMDENFPSRQGQGRRNYPETRASKVDVGQMRKLKPEQIAAPLNVDRNHIYVRSAAVPWRASA